MEKVFKTKVTIVPSFDEYETVKKLTNNYNQKMMNDDVGKDSEEQEYN